MLCSSPKQFYFFGLSLHFEFLRLKHKKISWQMENFSYFFFVFCYLTFFLVRSFCVYTQIPSTTLFYFNIQTWAFFVYFLFYFILHFLKHIASSSRYSSFFVYACIVCKCLIITLLSFTNETWFYYWIFYFGGVLFLYFSYCHR